MNEKTVDLSPGFGPVYGDCKASQEELAGFQVCRNCDQVRNDHSEDLKCLFAASTFAPKKIHRVPSDAHAELQEAASIADAEAMTAEWDTWNTEICIHCMCSKARHVSDHKCPFGASVFKAATFKAMRDLQSKWGKK